MQRIQYLSEHTEPAQQAFRTIDPAPALGEGTPTPELREQLLDEALPIFQRYRALFALRNQARPRPAWTWQAQHKVVAPCAQHLL